MLNRLGTLSIYAVWSKEMVSFSKCLDEMLVELFVVGNACSVIHIEADE